MTDVVWYLPFDYKSISSHKNYNVHESSSRIYIQYPNIPSNRAAFELRNLAQWSGSEPTDSLSQLNSIDLNQAINTTCTAKSIRTSTPKQY